MDFFDVNERVAENVNRELSKQLYNVPNLLTSLRLLLAVLVFVLLPLHLWLAALIVFLVAVSTDWVDGYWARRFGQVTQVGRMYDPFVDKIIICGTFIFLAAEPGSGIVPWMAVVVVAREMMVTGLRSFIEQRGGDFSAKRSGKLKMVFQCVAAAVSMATLRGFAQPSLVPDWLRWTLAASVWTAVVLTVYSGIVYVVAAARLRWPRAG